MGLRFFGSKGSEVEGFWGSKFFLVFKHLFVQFLQIFKVKIEGWLNTRHS